ALHQDVVDAMIHEIGADGIVPAGHECDLELRPHAVGARHEHRLTIRSPIEFEQPAEGADLREHTGSERGARERFNPANCFVPRVDVYARLSIIHARVRTPAW